MSALRSITMTLCAATAIGCTQVPGLADRAPYYEISQATLAEKAYQWEDATIAQVNREGLLLYTALDPKSWAPNGDGSINYLDSHNIADLPAWHGRLMAAAACAMASDNRDRNNLILRLAKGLETYYQTTGVPGLFGRSCLVGYDGERLDWMATQEQNPTKFWKKEDNGSWWRTGLAKNHFLGAVLGCGIPLALHKAGKINLREDVREQLLAVMLPAVRRFIETDYVITDYDGKPTEFGDLRAEIIPQEWMDELAPFVSWLGISEEDLEKLNQPINGFNMVLVLAILRSAADYDPSIRDRFVIEARAWGPGIRLSLEALGFAIKKIGHWRLDKPSYSDMEAISFAATLLFLLEPTAPVMNDVKAGLSGLWSYMRWERNAPFSIVYKQYVDSTVDISGIIQDMNDFPTPDQKVARVSGRSDTDEVQPLCNRTTNTNYWKSSPFRRALPPHDASKHPKTGAIKYFSGTDYLIAYWTLKLFGLDAKPKTP